jgi:sporulation protein YlmC with PRC-barrel domain
MGMRVEDAYGKKAGTVRNLILNMNDGRLRYVVVGAGGYLGVHATLKLAPAQAISAATAKSETLALNVTTPHWNQAPAFKYSSLANLADPARAHDVSRFFEMSGSTRPRGATNHLATTGREPAQANSPAPTLKLGSDLIGMRVVNQKQEKVGEVLDLLVGLGESRPAFVIISTGRLFHHGHQYAVPLNILARANNKLELDADATALEQAPMFDDLAWNLRGSNSLHVYRYGASE